MSFDELEAEFDKVENELDELEKLANEKININIAPKSATVSIKNLRNTGASRLGIWKIC